MATEAARANSAVPEHDTSASSNRPNGQALASIPLHIQSPLIYSSFISKKSGCQVYLKLDNTQPSGSFKTRGIGAFAKEVAGRHGSKTHLVIASGGNAGLACAYSARVLKVKCTVFIPQSTLGFVKERLAQLDADVKTVGTGWDEADKAARELVESDDHAVYVPAFDDPIIMKGNSTMILEAKTQLRDVGLDTPPDAIFCSVGGGGMLGGILEGLQTVGWGSVPVMACETYGAASLYSSLSSSHSSASSTNPPEVRMSTIPAITSIATTLGARTVSKECVRRCLQHPGGVVSVRMEDKRCVESLKEFADDHHILVEPACAASLAALYDPTHEMVKSATRNFPPTSSTRGPNILVIVCGGSTLSLDKISEWTEKFRGQDGLGRFDVDTWKTQS